LSVTVETVVIESVETFILLKSFIIAGKSPDVTGLLPDLLELLELIFIDPADLNKEVIIEDTMI
jgi:hypothetical protein